MRGQLLYVLIIQGLTLSTITTAENSLYVNLSRTDVNLYQSHWSVKSRSRSAGPTVYSKNMQKTVTMQCLITAIIAAEKFTLLEIVEGRMTDANLNSYVTPCLKKPHPCDKNNKNSIDKIFTISNSKNPYKIVQDYMQLHLD